MHSTKYLFFLSKALLTKRPVSSYQGAELYVTRTFLEGAEPHSQGYSVNHIDPAKKATEPKNGEQHYLSQPINLITNLTQQADLQLPSQHTEDKKRIIQACTLRSTYFYNANINIHYA